MRWSWSRWLLCSSIQYVEWLSSFCLHIPLKEPLNVLGLEYNHSTCGMEMKKMTRFILHCALLAGVQIESWCLACRSRYTNMGYYFIIMFAVICVLNLFAYSHCIVLAGGWRCIAELLVFGSCSIWIYLLFYFIKVCISFFCSYF